MKDFQYLAPRKLDEAVLLLAEHAGSAQLLAGGTDLLIFMRDGRKSPDFIIDAKKIPELTRVQLGCGSSDNRRRGQLPDDLGAPGNSRKISGFDRCCDLDRRDPDPGSGDIRRQPVQCAPSADTVPPVIVYGAIAHIISARGERDVPVEEICTGPGRTSLALMKSWFPVHPCAAGKLRHRVPAFYSA